MEKDGFILHASSQLAISVVQHQAGTPIIESPHGLKEMQGGPPASPAFQGPTQGPTSVLLHTQTGTMESSWLRTGGKTGASMQH